jgi:hypothetical protein
LSQRGCQTTENNHLKLSSTGNPANHIITNCLQLKNQSSGLEDHEEIQKRAPFLYIFIARCTIRLVRMEHTPMWILIVKYHYIKLTVDANIQKRIQCKMIWSAFLQIAERLDRERGSM